MSSDARASGAKARPPTVSVVIPAHNARDFIGDAIDSVLGQTFQDFEIVVVDDGSVDETASLIRSRFGSQVRLFRQQQGGASRARNRGIAEARGEFIAFLDADDLWLPTKLERQVMRFRNRPELGLVTTCHESFRGEQVFTKGHEKSKYLFGDGNVPRSIVINSGMATPTVMVPMAVLKHVGGFPEHLTIGEDDNLWIRITSRYPAELVDEVLVRCRLREGSLSCDVEQLCDDVLLSLNNLLAEGPEVRRQIASGVPLRRSALFWDRGWLALEEKEYWPARRWFFRAIRENPRNGRAWRFWIVSLLPGGIIEAARRLRRSL